MSSLARPLRPLRILRPLRSLHLLPLVVPLAVALGCSSDAGSDDGGDADGSGDDGPAPADVMCDGASFYELPANPATRGPWPVGARTVAVGGLKVEIWYPAVRGSQAGLDKKRYDIREQLPDAEQGKIPDAENPYQVCECFAELPLDEAHGPYPIIYFAHGTAGFRSQSAQIVAHWASRGYIVAAADHPKLMLKDALAFDLGGNQGAEAGQVLDALAAPSGELAFLAGHVDASKQAAAGHSAGGGAIAGFGSRPGMKLLMPMASRGTSGGSAATLVLGGEQDTIAMWDGVAGGYTSTQGTKWLVGLAKAGHLAFSDLCSIGRDQGGILAVATEFGVSVNPLIQRLARDGCEDDQLGAERGWEIIDHATSAALELTTRCAPAMADQLGGIRAAFPEVFDYQAAP